MSKFSIFTLKLFYVKKAVKHEVGSSLLQKDVPKPKYINFGVVEV